MALNNTEHSYGSVAIAIHWLMALMVMSLIVVGFLMGDMEDSPQKWQIYGIHKATGLLVLMFALFRWYWTLTSTKPKPLDGWSHGEIAMAHGLKWLLMIMIVLMPVSGIVFSIAGGYDISFYGLFTIAGLEQKNEGLADIAHEIHEFGAYTITFLVSMHILAALKHHFVRKDDTLNRMMGKS